MDNNPQSSDQPNEVPIEPTPFQQPYTPEVVQPVAPVEPAPTAYSSTPSVPVASGPVFGSPAPALASKKKSLLWLWITLGVLVILIGGLLTGFFVVKGSADKVADTYTTNVSTYLDEVYDAANSAADDPADVKKAVEEVSAPTLEKPFLAEISSKYTDAKKLQADAAAKVDTLESSIQSLADFSSFYTDLLKAQNKLIAAEKQLVPLLSATSVTKAQLTTVSTTMDDAASEMKTVTDGFSNPGAFKDDSDTLKGLVDDIKDATGSMIASLGKSDSTAYTAAIQDYIAAGKAYSTFATTINEYKNNLSSKVREAATSFKSDTESLKK